MSSRCREKTRVLRYRPYCAQFPSHRYLGLHGGPSCSIWRAAPTASGSITTASPARHLIPELVRILLADLT